MIKVGELGLEPDATVDAEARWVLVTDQDERSGLAVTRSLSAAGFNVTAVAPRRSAPGLWSRSAAQRRLIPSPAISVDAFLSALEAILMARPHALLLPVSDDSLSLLSRESARFAPLVKLGMPRADVVERALNRAAIGEAAAWAGLPPPESKLCHGVGEALCAARSLGFPLLIKPEATVIERGPATERRATRLAIDEQGVQAAVQDFGRCVVQRFSSGPVISFAGVVVGGELLGYVASQYLRTWPPWAGNASFSEVFAAPRSLVSSVQAFVSRLGWEGIFELELIRAPGAAYAAIDFNPRPYGSLGLTVAAGVPLPAIWARSCLGDPVQVRTARPGTRYRWEDGDFRHILWQVRKGGGSRAAMQLLPQRHVTHAYFQRADPGPLLARGVQFLEQEAPGLSGRLRSRLLARRACI